MFETEGLRPLRLGHTSPALMGGGNSAFQQMITVPRENSGSARELIEAMQGPVDMDALTEAALAAVDDGSTNSPERVLKSEDDDGERRLQDSARVRLPRPLGLAIGLVVGFAAGVLLNPSRTNKVPDGWVTFDDDKNGKTDHWFHYEDGLLTQSAEDRNADGRKDLWSFSNKGRYVRYESDANFDGVINEWGFYGDNQQLTLVKWDMNHDGKVDAWKSLGTSGEDEMKYDNDYDGRPDEWDFRKHGQVIERHRALVAGGAVDKKSYYKDGILTHSVYDRNHDGVFEIKKRFDRFGEQIEDEP